MAAALYGGDPSCKHEKTLKLGAGTSRIVRCMNPWCMRILGTEPFKCEEANRG